MEEPKTFDVIEFLEKQAVRHVEHIRFRLFLDGRIVEVTHFDFMKDAMRTYVNFWTGSLIS